MALRTVFFGTPPFARTILEALLEHGIEVVAVVTKPDKPTHRSSEPIPPAVKQSALAHHLPVLQPLKASDPEFVKTILEPLCADVFIVAAFSEILKENLLSLPPLGCINVHASLLPKYRGAAPIQRCIMDGEKESGVTIMAMDIGLDTGGMFKKVVVPISSDMTAGELSIALAQQGAIALVEVLRALEKGEIQPIPQPEGEKIYAKKLTSEEGRIDWNLPASTVYNRIRGVTPKPGAWCEVEVRGQKKRMGVKIARLSPSTRGPVGTLLKTEEFPLIVACQSGGVALLEVQLEGKKSLDIQTFLNGISFDQLKFYLCD